VQPHKCVASHIDIYFNRVNVVGSVGLSNIDKILGFRHPSLFSKRGDGGEVFEVNRRLNNTPTNSGKFPS
jgi:hypothetical protein